MTGGTLKGTLIIKGKISRYGNPFRWNLTNLVAGIITYFTPGIPN
jgi:hypothetical protein